MLMTMLLRSQGFSRFKAEWMQDSAFTSKTDAPTEILEYIDTHHNSIRRHASLNYVALVKFKQLYHNK